MIQYHYCNICAEIKAKPHFYLVHPPESLICLAARRLIR